MTAAHRRLREVTLCLIVLLAVLLFAFFALIEKYNELEAEHLSTYAAFETCDIERWQGSAP